jgi:hypothetical protein
MAAITGRPARSTVPTEIIGKLWPVAAWRVVDHRASTQVKLAPRAATSGMTRKASHVSGAGI